MAFITVAGNVVSYAEYTDVLQKDQRIFESNELIIPEESGFADVTEFVEDMLEKATARINVKIKASSWWFGYQSYIGNSVANPALLPNFDANKIKARQQDFTDMCVYYALKEYILPLITDFGNEESNELAKITYYDVKFNDIFKELIDLADWFDADGDGTIEASEKAWTFQQVRRSRRRTTVTKVR